MIPQQYSYLFGTLIFFIPWIILFYHRKDLRKQMFVMSLFFAIVGMIAEYLWWTKDWWKPTTITGSVIGIEDFLLGFANGGTAVVLYEELFRKQLYKRGSRPRSKQTFAVVIVTFLIMGYSFWIIKYTSFIATVLGLLITGIILLFLRSDLLFSSLINGCLMMLIAFPVFYILMLVSPTFIQYTWVLPKLSGVFVTGIPIEDIIFYFLTGFVAAPLYEYWQGLGLRKKSSKNR